MDRELTQDYLTKAGMDATQAEALSRILSDMWEQLATKADLAALRAELKGEMATLRAELRGEMAALRAELKGDMATLRAELKGDMASLKADLTWRFIAVTAFLATVMTLLNLFVD